MLGGVSLVTCIDLYPLMRCAELWQARLMWLFLLRVHMFIIMLASAHGACSD